MKRRGLRSNAGLIFLTVVALLYGVFESTVVEVTQWDGALGVVLGLFICAQPAANLLDSLYRTSRERSSEPRWLELILNALAMLAGITIIIIGTTQLSRATAAR
jgi:MFS superfamily sulfate permease-like transporter